MSRKLDLSRDEAEMLVDLLDSVCDQDFRYAQIDEAIRELFGMATRARQKEVAAERSASNKAGKPN